MVGGPVPARPCISGPRTLASLSSLLLTLRSDCSHVPQKATRRAVLYQTGCCFVATSMAMSQSKETVELMNTLDASPSSWLVRLVIEWHYQQPATTVSGEKETSLSLQELLCRSCGIVRKRQQRSHLAQSAGVRFECHEAAVLVLCLLNKEGKC